MENFKIVNGEKIHLRRSEDFRGQKCECSVCKKIAYCLPNHDFYGSEGELLVCEPCFFLKVTKGRTSTPDIVL